MSAWQAVACPYDESLVSRSQKLTCRTEEQRMLHLNLSRVVSLEIHLSAVLCYDPAMPFPKHGYYFSVHV